MTDDDHSFRDIHVMDRRSVSGFVGVNDGIWTGRVSGRLRLLAGWATGNGGNLQIPVTSNGHQFVTTIRCFVVTSLNNPLIQALSMAWWLISTAGLPSSITLSTRPTSYRPPRIPTKREHNWNCVINDASSNRARLHSPWTCDGPHGLDFHRQWAHGAGMVM